MRPIHSFPRYLLRFLPLIIIAHCVQVDVEGCFAGAESLPTDAPDWPSVFTSHGDRISRIDSNQSAKEAFVTPLGPSLGLSDAAGTIGAKGLPAKLTKDLLLPDITDSAQRLVAALAAWQLADALTQSLAEPAPPRQSPSVTSAKLEWLNANGPFGFLMQAIQSPNEKESGSDRTTVAVLAGRATIEASQQAMSQWLRLKSWKDRVRHLRGRARLCGTWQWVVHNHQQRHHEQKLSLLFPPPGMEGTGISGLTETIVLGDTVYLRWEMEGRTQEDSLLFSKEGQRLEGTFVNSQGGWGSISGKRTANCAP